MIRKVFAQLSPGGAKKKSRNIENWLFRRLHNSILSACLAHNNDATLERPWTQSSNDFWCSRWTPFISIVLNSRSCARWAGVLSHKSKAPLETWTSRKYSRFAQHFYSRALCAQEAIYHRTAMGESEEAINRHEGNKNVINLHFPAYR